jgi:hypothetical protein
MNYNGPPSGILFIKDPAYYQNHELDANPGDWLFQAKEVMPKYLGRFVRNIGSVVIVNYNGIQRSCLQKHIGTIYRNPEAK